MHQGERLEDLIVTNKIKYLYKLVEQHFKDRPTIKSHQLPKEGTSCRNILAVSAENVIALLGEYETIEFRGSYQ